MKRTILLLMMACLLPSLLKAQYENIWSSALLWLSPESMITDTNNNLTSWNDRTGRNVMTATVRNTSPNKAECPGDIPTVSKSVINGFSAVNMNSVIAFEGDELGKYRTVFVLAKPTTANGVLFGLREDSDVNTHPYFGTGSSGLIAADGANAQTTTYSSTAMVLYNVCYENPNFDILSANGANYAGATKQLKRSIQKGYPLLGQRLEAYDRENGRISGQIVEVLAFDNPLSDLQRWHVESYFAFKYGLTMSGFSSSAPRTNTTYRKYVTSDLNVAWDGTSGSLSSFTDKMCFVVRDDSAKINLHTAKSLTISGTSLYQMVNGKSFATPAALGKNLSYAICGTNSVLNTAVSFVKVGSKKLFYQCWDKQFKFRQQNVPVVSMQVVLSSDQKPLVDAANVGALCYTSSDTLYRKGVYNASTGVLTLDSLPLGAETSLRIVFKAQACVPINGMNPGSISNINLGQDVSVNFRVLNQTDTYTYTISSGTLPSGLSLSPDGLLSGRPAEGGTYPITVRATSSQGGCTFDKNFTVNVQCAAITISPTSLNPVEESKAVEVSYTASGGESPYTFSIASGSLPQGVSLSSTGLLSGTPASGSAANYSFVVKASDVHHCASELSFALQVLLPTSAKDRAYFDLKLFPNPVGSLLAVQTKALQETLRIEVYDASAHLLWTQSYDAFHEIDARVDMSKFPAGIYFIKLTAGKNTCVEQVYKR